MKGVMDFLKNLRKRRGKSQQELANALGMTRQTYARREAHPEELSIAEALVICKVLEIDIEELIDSVVQFVEQAGA